MLRRSFQFVVVILLHMDQPFILAMLKVITPPSRRSKMVFGKAFRSFTTRLHLPNPSAKLIQFLSIRSFGKAHFDHALGALRKFQRTRVRCAVENRILEIL